MATFYRCTVSLHHRRKEWHTAASVALKVRHPSVYLASLVIQVFNPCSLSPIAAASSSSASVVFVCSAALPSPFVCRSRSRLRSAVVFVRVLRRSRSLGVHCSRSLAVHHSSSHSCSSGSHVALLQTLRLTRALHLAVQLLSFVAAVSSLNPPPDNTLTQHQYSASNFATSDFYYNK
ncbi:Putative RNA-directed DNA polymerase [Arachis hypogaea]|nr:Putative RNA-directed DNA polymerase [Arachis hypogaea]